MAQQTINIGAAANDATGDSARAGGQKINANFTELYGKIASALVYAGATLTLTLADGTVLTATIPVGASPSVLAPLMDGVAAAGVSAAYSPEDHRHPTDTSRAAALDLTNEIARATAAELLLNDADIDTANIVGSNLVITLKGGATKSVDITSLLADVKLATLVYNSGTKALDGTMSDGSTFSVPVSDLFQQAATAISPAAANATGAVGTSSAYAREDHQHPAQGVSADAGNMLAVGADGLHTFAGKARVHLTDTVVAPASAGAPTLVEIVAAAGTARNTILYYTGTDAPADVPTYAYWIDKDGAVTLIERPSAPVVVPVVQRITGATGTINAATDIVYVEAPVCALTLPDVFARDDRRLLIVSDWAPSSTITLAASGPPQSVYPSAFSKSVSAGVGVELVPYENGATAGWMVVSANVSLSATRSQWQAATAYAQSQILETSAYNSAAALFLRSGAAHTSAGTFQADASFMVVEGQIGVASYPGAVWIMPGLKLDNGRSIVQVVGGHVGAATFNGETAADYVFISQHTIATYATGTLYLKGEMALDASGALYQCKVSHLSAGANISLDTFATNWKAITSGAQAGLYETVTQAAHGLSFMNAVHHNGTAWAKSQANAAATVAQGVVVGVVDVNTFIVGYAGALPVAGHGLTPGEYYWLSQATAGLLTLTQPTTGIVQGVLHARDANTLLVNIGSGLSL